MSEMINAEAAGLENEHGDVVKRALGVLRETDRMRNLTSGFAVLLFVVCGAIGYLVFWLVVDIAARLADSEYEASMFTTAALIALFLAWLLSYLFFSVALNALGFGDIRATATRKLRELHLGPADLQELRGLAASRVWRHGRTLKSVIDKLAD